MIDMQSFHTTTALTAARRTELSDAAAAHRLAKAARAAATVETASEPRPARARRSAPLSRTIASVVRALQTPTPVWGDQPA